MENLRVRTVLAILGLALVAFWLLPNVVDLGDKAWSKKLNYGLDIQGGLHLVMGVDVDGVVAESTTRLTKVLQSDFKTENIGVNSVVASNPTQGEIKVELATPADKEKVTRRLDDRYASMLQVIDANDKTMTLRYLESHLTQEKDKIIQQSIETIRNRIDEFGVAEPSISKQGSNRILVQLPGMADAERAKALINTAARLDFMMVDDERLPQNLPQLIDDAEKAGGYSFKDMKYTEYVARLNNDLKNKLPEKTMVLFEKADNATNMDAGRVPYLLKTDTDLTGEALDDAFVSFDQYGTPEVALRFNALGANRFKQITGQNIGKRMAVVLDKVIKTAPSLRTEIGDGQAVITLGGGRDRERIMDEAKMIATSLRAGALPASLEQLEERRVGPTLGMDSVKKAEVAGAIGALLIFLFMIARYRGMGVISCVCMSLNIIAVIALLSAFGATLTLPGIAGIALTVGFAVDANVLIIERMREELRKGASFVASVREGYSRAMSAILDSNITTGATAVVLLYFGTGPIRGFAVTLLLGIVTTLFANVFISRWVLDVLIVKFGLKKLSV